MGRTFYYLGRLAQLIGMWMLLVDLMMAGPAWPSPKLFGAGVAVFVAGWGLTRALREHKVGPWSDLCLTSQYRIARVGSAHNL